MSTEAFVYDAVRTPRGRGKSSGSLHATKPVSLVVGLLDELRKRNPGLDPAEVEATCRRVDRLLREGCMPMPDPYRHVIPWPPF